MNWRDFESNSIRLGKNLSKSIVTSNFNQIQSNEFNESISISTLDKPPIKFYQIHFINQILSAHLINLSNLIK